MYSPYFFRYDPESDILYPSTFEYDWRETGILGRLFVFLYRKLGIIKLTEINSSGNIVSGDSINPGSGSSSSIGTSGRVRLEGTNCTLVNLMLIVFNPMREDNLTKCILVLQLLCSLLAFFIRYGISKFIY